MSVSAGSAGIGYAGALLRDLLVINVAGGLRYFIGLQLRIPASVFRIPPTELPVEPMEWDGRSEFALACRHHSAKYLSMRADRASQRPSLTATFSLFRFAIGFCICLPHGMLCPSAFQLPVPLIALHRVFYANAGQLQVSGLGAGRFMAGMMKSARISVFRGGGGGGIFRGRECGFWGIFIQISVF